MVLAGINKYQEWNQALRSCTHYHLGVDQYPKWGRIRNLRLGHGSHFWQNVDSPGSVNCLGYSYFIKILFIFYSKEFCHFQISTYLKISQHPQLRTHSRKPVTSSTVQKTSRDHVDVVVRGSGRCFSSIPAALERDLGKPSCVRCRCHRKKPRAIYDAICMFWGQTFVANNRGIEIDENRLYLFQKNSRCHQVQVFFQTSWILRCHHDISRHRYWHQWETACSWVGSIPPSGWDWCWSPSNSLQKKSLILWKYKNITLSHHQQCGKITQNKWKFVLQNDISNIKMDMKTGSIAGMGHHSQHAFHPIPIIPSGPGASGGCAFVVRLTAQHAELARPQVVAFRGVVDLRLRQICPIENGVKHQSPKTLENH